MNLEGADEDELDHVDPGRLSFLANGDVGQVLWKFQFFVIAVKMSKFKS